MFLGTTWEKQEGRFLLGSSTEFILGSTGGSTTTTLTKANLPATKLQLDSFSLGRGTMEITASFFGGNRNAGYVSGAYQNNASPPTVWGGGGSGAYINFLGTFAASRSWTGMSTSAAPYTTNMGDSTPFSNMPPYLVVNIWKRLS